MVIIEYKDASSTDLTNPRQLNVSTFTPVKINLGVKNPLSSPKITEKSEAASPNTESPKVRSRTESISSQSSSRRTSRSRSKSSSRTSRSSSRTTTKSIDSPISESVNKPTAEVAKPVQTPQVYANQIQGPLFPNQQPQFFNQPPGTIPQQQRQQGFYNPHAISQDQNYRFLLFHRNWRTFMRRFFGFIDFF